MHVVFVADTLTIGGTELNAVRTAEALVSRGITPTLVHFQPDGPLLGRYAALGLRIINYPVVPFSSPRALVRAWQLGHLLRELRPDVVHAHDVYANIYCAAARTAFPRMPLVTSRRWAHSVPRPILMPVNAMAHRLSRAVVANSMELVPLLRTEGVAASRVHVWPNFISPAAAVQLSAAERTAWRLRLGVPTDATVVVCVARLAPVKRHADLIHAFATARADHPDLHLLLVGDGPSESALRELVASIGIGDATTFAGHLSATPLPQQLGDIAILMSENEGFPNSLVEALMCGLPVIASRTGGTNEILDGGRNGIAVDVGDIPAAAAAIAAFVGDAERRRVTGSDGRRFALARYSEDSSISALRAAYAHAATGTA